MTRTLRRILLVLAALALGAAAFLAFGHKPGAGATQAAGGVDWSLPSPAAVELAAADEVWMSRAPWGALPRPTNAEPQPPPPPVPVGIVASGGKFRACSWSRWCGDPRRAGDALPDGGVSSRFPVPRDRVDGQGTKHEQECSPIRCRR